ncbi:MAG: 50S ribosomal protein L21 [Dehalococcoidia bacterium]|nr:50S ribosomal protein L21 [Dehalococcoidia bacterium]
MHAIVEDRGQQYSLKKGEVLDLARRTEAPGQQLELDRVLLVRDGDQVAVGQPTVPGARVIAEVLEETKGRKVTVFKYKSSVRYRRLRGHRQRYCRVKITDIVLGDGASADAEAS